MKAIRIRSLAWLCLCLWMALCVCIGCTADDADPDTEPSADTLLSAVSDTETDTDTGTPTDTEMPSETATEVLGEPWYPETGVFNAGVVSYEKIVETEVIAAFPEEKLGQSVSREDVGVTTIFYSDFADGDATVGGTASMYHTGKAVVVDGCLRLPYDPETASGFADFWTTWSPIPTADLEVYQQIELSMDWDVYTAADGAWMTAIVGCYISNYAGKIPDNPGDGLWISFNETGSKLSIYHPDSASWPTAWVDVPVAAGLLKGMHHVNIVCMPDRTTYVYITAEGSDTERLVCTVRFADGMIRVYDEAETLIKEDACTTDSLKGGNFTIFPHGGSGAIVDEIAVLGCSKGEVIKHVSVTATPAEGQTLGLDITDQTGLVSMCYSVWFDAILGGGTTPVESYLNITEILAGQQNWGSVPSFHYWAKPALGYYRSSDKAVIRTHMTQLYAAGVDFLIIDLTNAHDGYLGTASWSSFIQAPMDAICDTIMEMRADGEGTPYVAFWVGNWVGETERLYKELYEHYIDTDQWRDCFVYWEGKPFLLTTHMDPEDFPYPELYTVRRMWGLSVDYEAGWWSFLSVDNSDKITYGQNGTPEQISVAVASQETYMSASTAHGREGGAFWFRQWYTAFAVRPKIVTLTWWNEWAAQRLQVENEDHVIEYHFTDNYTQEFSRDIEPMTGGHGDQYYRWLIAYISAYKGGQACPVLVEDAYTEAVNAWLAEQD